MTARRSLLVLALFLTALAPAWACAQDASPPAAETPVGWWPPGTTAAPARTPCGDRMCPAGTVCVVEGCQTHDGHVVDTEAFDLEHARRHRHHERLIVASGLILAAGWLAELVFSSFAGYHTESESWSRRPAGFEPGWDDFRFAGYVPLAGPWIQLAMGRGDGSWTAYSALFGVAQFTGLVLLVVGAVLDLNDAPDPDLLAVAPMLGSDAVGILVGGRF